MDHERFRAVAHRVLDGDDSRRTTQELEGVVLADYADDERFEDLLYVLSLFSPGQSAPYTSVDDLRSSIQRTLALVD